jgi:hypothetical protein
MPNFNGTVMGSNTEVRQKKKIHSSSCQPSGIFQFWHHDPKTDRLKQLYLLLKAMAKDEYVDDEDTLIGLDEHFRVAWVVDGEEEVFQRSFKGEFGEIRKVLFQKNLVARASRVQSGK